MTLCQKTECWMGLIDLANLRESDKVLITCRQSAVSTSRCWHFLQESSILCFLLSPSSQTTPKSHLKKKENPHLHYTSELSHLVLMFFARVSASVTIIISISHVCHQNPIFLSAPSPLPPTDIYLFAHNNHKLVLENVLLIEKKKQDKKSCIEGNMSALISGARRL